MFKGVFGAYINWKYRNIKYVLPYAVSFTFIVWYSSVSFLFEKINIQVVKFKDTTRQQRDKNTSN